MLSASRSVIVAFASAPEAPYGYTGTHTKESQTGYQRYASEARATGEGELGESGGACHLSLRLSGGRDVLIVGGTCGVASAVVGARAISVASTIVAATATTALIYDAVLDDIVLVDSIVVTTNGII